MSQGEGSHGIRFRNKNLEYFDTEIQTWRLASPPPIIYGVEIDESNSNPETASSITTDYTKF